MIFQGAKGFDKYDLSCHIEIIITTQCHGFSLGEANMIVILN
jgi:hypothetical protein